MDFDALRRRTLNDAGMMSELLRLFRTETPVGLGRLRAALESGDFSTAARQAHRLKGAAATVSAAVLASLFSDTETLCTTNNPAAHAQLPQIEAEFARCMAEIENLGL